MKHSRYFILTLGILLVFELTSLASQRFYLLLGGGYSGVFSPQNIPAGIITGGWEFNNFDATMESITISNNMTSLGQGVNASLIIGYSLAQNFSIEMGIQNLWSNTITANQTNHLTVISNETETYYLLPRKLDISATMFRLNPAVSISTDFWGMKPYARLGLMLGWGSIDFREDFQQVSIETNLPVNSSDLGLEMTGGYSMGFTADLGLEFRIIERLSLMTELKTVAMDYIPVKGQIYHAEINDRDVFDNLSIAEKDFNFVDSITQSIHDEPQPNQPGKFLKNSFPFNSIGFNIGLKFRF